MISFTIDGCDFLIIKNDQIYEKVNKDMINITTNQDRIVEKLNNWLESLENKSITLKNDDDNVETNNGPKKIKDIPVITFYNNSEEGNKEIQYKTLSISRTELYYADDKLDTSKYPHLLPELFYNFLSFSELGEEITPK